MKEVVPMAGRKVYIEPFYPMEITSSQSTKLAKVTVRFADTGEEVNPRRIAQRYPKMGGAGSPGFTIQGSLYLVEHPSNMLRVIKEACAAEGLTVVNPPTK